MPQLELPPDHVTTAAEAIEMRRHVHKMRVLGIRVKPQVASFTTQEKPAARPAEIQSALVRTAEMMIRHSCAYYNVTRDDIMSNMRCSSNADSYAATVTCARHVAIYFTARVHKNSAIEIGKIFGRNYNNITRSCLIVRDHLATMSGHAISRGARAIEQQLSGRVLS